MLVSFLLFLNQIKAVSWYVNPMGDDSYNGLSAVYTTGLNGPKKTINNAHLWANSADTVHIKKGLYLEDVLISKDLYIDADSVSVKAWEMNGASVYSILFGSYLDIIDTLRLTQGFMYIDKPAFQLRMRAGSVIVGGSVLSYVEGRLYYEFSTGTGRLPFPLGLVGDFRPVYLNFHQNIADNRIHWIEMVDKPTPFANKLPAGIRNTSAVRYWKFGRVDTGNPTDYIFELGYDSTLYDDHVRDAASLRLLFNPDTAQNWQDLGGNGDTNRKGTLKSGISTDTVGLLAIGNVDGGFNPLATDLPFAKFVYAGVCEKSSFKFYNRSINLPNPKITAWNWDFGVPLVNTDTSSAANPTFTFTNAGLYTVKLKITNDSGDMDSAMLKVKVSPLPYVKFSSNAACYNDATLLVDSSKVALPDTIFSRFWKSSDGFTSSLKKASRIYGSVGSYNIKLISTTSAGCKDSTTGIAKVRPLPLMNFTTSNGCINDTIVYKRTRGADPVEASLTYQWNIDNAIVGTDTVHKIRYNNALKHTVILIATDNFGCVDLLAKDDTTFSLPILSFTLNKSITGNDSLQCKTTNKFTFSKTIKTSQSQTFTGSWSYGDGQVGLLKDTTHSYAAMNVYKVKLFANTNRGCKDSFERTYVVRGALTPRIAKIGVCAPDSITLYDTASTFTTSPIKSWKWYLPGGAIDSGKSIRVWNKFPTPGIVKLVVTNSEGCIDSVSKAFGYTPYPAPILWVNPVPLICPGDSVMVTVTGGTAYRWMVDNDTVSIKKKFKSGGLFPVKVFNGSFCSKIDSTLLIIMKPAAVISAFSDTTIQRNSTANLRAAGGVSYTWSPNLYLNMATGANVKATPTETTTYFVTGKNASGCSAMDSVKVRVLEPLFIRIPNIITPNGDNQNDAWVISDIKDLASFDVTITNFQGKIVFTSSGYLNDWNATKEGKELPEGVYYYNLFNRKTDETLKGFIQVIR